MGGWKGGLTIIWQIASMSGGVYRLRNGTREDSRYGESTDAGCSEIVVDLTGDIGHRAWDQ